MKICEKCIYIVCKEELIFKYKGDEYSITDLPCKEEELDLGSYKYCYRIRCSDRLKYFLNQGDFIFLSLEIERQLRDGDLIKLKNK